MELWNWFAANPSTLAALSSAIATALAAFAAWKGPASAARIAENLRRTSEKTNENRRMKLLVFSTIMQERATIHSLDCVRMLNSIDFVFNDTPDVRESWAELYNVLNSAGSIHPQLREDKLRSLLKAMAEACGLSGQLRSDDFGRIYYPNSIARREELEALQTEEQLRGLQERAGVQGPAADFSARFPPAPSA